MLASVDWAGGLAPNIFSEYFKWMCRDQILDTSMFRLQNMFTILIYKIQSKGKYKF